MSEELVYVVKKCCTSANGADHWSFKDIYNTYEEAKNAFDCAVSHYRRNQSNVNEIVLEKYFKKTGNWCGDLEDELV